MRFKRLFCLLLCAMLLTAILPASAEVAEDYVTELKNAVNRVVSDEYADIEYSKLSETGGEYEQTVTITMKHSVEDSFSVIKNYAVKILNEISELDYSIKADINGTEYVIEPKMDMYDLALDLAVATELDPVYNDEYELVGLTGATTLPLEFDDSTKIYFTFEIINGEKEEEKEDDHGGSGRPSSGGTKPVEKQEATDNEVNIGNVKYLLEMNSTGNGYMLTISSIAEDLLVNIDNAALATMLDSAETGIKSASLVLKLGNNIKTSFYGGVESAMNLAGGENLSAAAEMTTSDDGVTLDIVIKAGEEIIELVPDELIIGNMGFENPQAVLKCKNGLKVLQIMTANDDGTYTVTNMKSVNVLKKASLADVEPKLTRSES